jgi:hypothetical protein
MQLLEKAGATTELQIASDGKTPIEEKEKKESKTGIEKSPGVNVANKAIEHTANIDNINIDKDFEYVPEMCLAVEESSAVGLRFKPYETLTKEPKYSSANVLYGYFVLGNSEDNKISFAIDNMGNEQYVYYVDKNNNEDLTDDGPPGKFGVDVSLDVDVISLTGEKIIRPYKFYFGIRNKNFTDNSITDNTVPKLYSKCHYKGQVIIGGEKFDAVAYEYDKHNALYQESGLWVDLNKDGKMDQDKEHFGNGETLTVMGRQYTLGLNYP